MQTSETLHISGRWEPVDYAFPQGSRRLPSVACIYGWFVDGLPVYVGQAEQLSRRVAGYESPGPSQRTNIRLKASLGNCLQHGQCVELRVLSEIQVNGITVGNAELGDKRLRDLLEAYYIWYFGRSGYHLLNI